MDLLKTLQLCERVSTFDETITQGMIRRQQTVRTSLAQK